MKSNASSTNTSAKNSSSKRSQATDKRSTARNMDSTAATDKVRSRASHGGMNNEGTNVNYEEER